MNVIVTILHFGPPEIELPLVFTTETLCWEFAGFNENELTSSDGGKGEVIKHLIQKFGYSNIVMIGDGNTDAEASPPAHAFIGYGGNVVREAVKNKSQWYVTDFQELIDELS
nr:phosphoserine phosphatase-like [Halyomorpha halys]